MNKITNLLKELKKTKCDIYILPASDEFLNEFVPQKNKRLQWLTNFTGSNGIAFISEKKKVFFTDGRYLLQAKKELDSDFRIFDQSKMGLVKFIEQSAKEKKFLMDTRLFSKELVKKLKTSSKQNKNKIIHDKDCILDKLWNSRVYSEKNTVYNLQLKFAGVSRDRKLKKFLDFYSKYDSIILSSPESICWLLNIRGNGLEFTPVILCRVIVFYPIVHLFVEQDLINQLYFLKKKNIRIYSLDKFPLFIKKIKKSDKVYVDKNLSYYFYQILISRTVKVDSDKDFCRLNKSQKNKTEIEVTKISHVYDGIALVKFLYWLDNFGIKKEITEYDASEKLNSFRLKNKNFVSRSFPTIAACGENGAIIHYTPKTMSKVLKKGESFLCDSGAQYYGATTDVTRTIILGNEKPSDFLKAVYTDVLMGHIDISKLKFPKGTIGSQIDVLGRNYLWQKGLDYNHGTGHGVGSFLSVHESPPNISKKNDNFELKPGMILSNEPGCYLKNKFGVRIENLMIIKEDTNPGFLGFETLTLCPYQKKLIDKSKLNNGQITWINKYNKKIWESLKNHLNEEERMWLKKNTKKL